MRLAGFAKESFVDGPGVRFVIFTQGCPHRCPYCQNPETWETDAGKEFSVKQILRLIKQQKKLKRGVTFSGGEPFLQAAELAELAHSVHELGMDVVTYTGYTYEELIAADDKGMNALLCESDILIDGRYVHELRDTTLQFRGSSNQRLINVTQTQKKGQIVLWRERKNSA